MNVGISTRTLSLLCFGALLSLCANGAWAQTSTAGTVFGQVVDEQNAAVAGATLKVTDLGTNITVTTSEAEIEAFHRVGSEQVKNFPDHIETLIIPAGSRNSAVSILYGLHRYSPKSLKKIILMNINKNLEKHESVMWERLKACGVGKLPYEMETYDLFANGYTNYEKLMPFTYGDLTAHPRYEGKCFNFIDDHPEVFSRYMNPTTLFWIVGGKPKTIAPAATLSREIPGLVEVKT